MERLHNSNGKRTVGSRVLIFGAGTFEAGLTLTLTRMPWQMRSRWHPGFATRAADQPRSGQPALAHRPIAPRDDDDRGAAKFTRVA